MIRAEGREEKRKEGRKDQGRVWRSRKSYYDNILSATIDIIRYIGTL